MTFLEFCQGYFPKEKLFYEMEGLLVVELQRLFGLLMRMKREWEDAQELGPGKHGKELEHESGWED